MQRKQYYVYIVSSYIKAIYIGCSSDLLKRVYQHKTKTNADSHTALYNINRLVYYEIYEDSYNANCRERQLKKWNRSKKIALIERENPAWNDLSVDWFDKEPEPF